MYSAGPSFSIKMKEPKEILPSALVLSTQDRGPEWIRSDQ